MKKHIIILFTLLLPSLILSAQVRENESALVYFMPKTELVFEIEYEQTTSYRGRFYQYSERYLGTKDVVLEDGVNYKLLSVSLHTRTIADTERAFTIPLNSKTIQNYSVNLTKKGILESVNTECSAVTKEKTPDPATKKSHKKSALLLPFSEEQLLSGSTSKMAESVAKQIYAIRENRLNLLAGEVEHLPADGETMKLMLKQLDKQELVLTELFTGKRKTEKKIQQIVLTPTESITDTVLFRFSKLEGVVDADDVVGEPYILTLNAHKQNSPQTDGKNKAPRQSPIFHNLPGSADIMLTDPKGEVVISRSLPIPQFGIALPLAADLFEKHKTQVVFNTKTGQIIQIR